LAINDIQYAIGYPNTKEIEIVIKARKIDFPRIIHISFSLKKLSIRESVNFSNPLAPFFSNNMYNMIINNGKKIKQLAIIKYGNNNQKNWLEKVTVLRIIF
jgi:hypothetical protein